MSFIGRVANIEAGEGEVPIERISNLAMNKWYQLSEMMLASLENYLSKQKPSKKSKRETAAERETNKKRFFRSPEDIEAEREATRQKYSQMETEKAAKDVVAKYNEAKKAFAAYALAEETY